MENFCEACAKAYMPEIATVVLNFCKLSSEDKEECLSFGYSNFEAGRMTKIEVLEKWARIIYEEFPKRREVTSTDPDREVSDGDFEVVHDESGLVVGMVEYEDVPWEELDNKGPYYETAKKLWSVVG